MSDVKPQKKQPKGDIIGHETGTGHDRQPIDDTCVHLPSHKKIK